MPEPITAIVCRRVEGEAVNAIALVVRPSASRWFDCAYAAVRGPDQSDPAGPRARMKADARMCPQQRSGIRQVARAAAEKDARHA
jgi:hypothetical protein